MLNSLYLRIKHYQMDDPDSELPFSRRLASDNLWTHEYALRVIEEYKKFIYLGTISSVTPSDQVDQCWHLHMLYTRDYWGPFRELIGKDFHHGPTRGGVDENRKYEDLYMGTKILYYKEFKEIPPCDIWPVSMERFTERYARVCLDKNVIIDVKSYPILTRIIKKIMKLCSYFGFS